MKKFFNGLYWVIIGGALIQFVPVDRTTPPLEASKSFVIRLDSPLPVRQVLRRACYDCHSYETVYPFYAFVAPVSWSINHNVDRGRRHLNFSVWGDYNKELKKGMLEKAVASINRRSMPVPGYVAKHPEARLSPQEQKMLEDYFQSILDSGSYEL